MNNQNPNATQPVLTRNIPAWNGVMQIVSMETGWWECLDWLIEHKGFSLQRITNFCCGFVQRNPEEKFADIFNYFIHYHMMLHLAERHNLANDNFIGSQPVWEKR